MALGLAGRAPLTALALLLVVAFAGAFTEVRHSAGADGNRTFDPPVPETIVGDAMPGSGVAAWLLLGLLATVAVLIVARKT